MKKLSKGTTFAELLVVLAIVAIFSGFVLLNWRAGEKDYTLQRAATKLSQDIRRVESFSLSAKEIIGHDPLIPSGGYGIYFNSNSAEKNHYIIFADFNGSHIYDSGDLVIEDIQTERDVEIKELSASPLLNVVFLPPNPQIFITPEATSAQIVLALKDNQTKTKTITINKLGLITITQ